MLQQLFTQCLNIIQQIITAPSQIKLLGHVTWHRVEVAVRPIEMVTCIRWGNGFTGMLSTSLSTYTRNKIFLHTVLCSEAIADKNAQKLTALLCQR